MLGPTNTEAGGTGGLTVVVDRKLAACTSIGNYSPEINIRASSTDALSFDSFNRNLAQAGLIAGQPNDAGDYTINTTHVSGADSLGNDSRDTAITELNAHPSAATDYYSNMEGEHLTAIATGVLGNILSLKNEAVLDDIPSANHKTAVSFTHNADGGSLGLVASESGNNLVFISSITASVAENTAAVTTFTATDLGLPAETPVRFSIVGGADRAKFSITKDGALTFNAPPDFEAPTDANGDNIYAVTVQANPSNGGTISPSGPNVTMTETSQGGFKILDFFYSSSTGAEFTNYKLNVQSSTGADLQDPIRAARSDQDGDTLDTWMNTVDSLFGINTASYIFNAYNPASLGSGAPPVQQISWSVFDTAAGDTNTFDAGPPYGFVNAPFHLARILVSPSGMGTAQFTAFDTSFAGVGTVFNFSYGYPVPEPRTQNVNVTVTPINDNNPVFISSNTASVAENTTAVKTVTATDADLPAQTVAFTIVGGADQAKFRITTDGVLSFATAPNYEAPTDANLDNNYVVTVQASDGNGGLTSQTIDVTVTPVNDAPAASPHAYSTTENQTLTIGAPGVLVAATDVDSPMLTALLVNGPTHGTLTLNANGAFIYCPAATYSGHDSFTYKVNDGQLDSNDAMVDLTIAMNQQIDQAFIFNAYWSLLGRRVHKDELRNCLSVMANGTTAQGVVQSICNSPERRQYSTKEVDGFYRNILGRAPDPAGRQTWIDAMVHGVSREDVLIGFLNTGEFAATHVSDESFVDAIHRSILERRAKKGERQNWLNFLSQGGTRAATIYSLIHSTTYLAAHPGAFTLP